MKGQNAPPKQDPLLSNLGLTSHIGFTMVFSILICLYLGHVLDNWIGTESICKLISIPIGVATGFWSVHKIIDKVLKCDLDDKR